MYFLLIGFFLILLLNPVYAQETKNPSLILYKEEIPYYEFNTIARESSLIELEEIHEISWQITLINNLLYENPNGNAVLRFYDAENEDNFVEIGMGGPPEYKFWVAAQLPSTGYVIIQRTLERGWGQDARITASYTEDAGFTVNNGQRIVVSNLDIGTFAIDSYSVHGMESSTDPPAINSGNLVLEILSGDPSQNVLHLFPFYITAAVGAIAGILFLTKKRSS